MTNCSIKWPLDRKTPFIIIGKYSGDKESVDITADMTCYVWKIEKCYVNKEEKADVKTYKFEQLYEICDAQSM